MKRWLVCLILLGLFILAGCSRPIEFNGKSEFWNVDCSVDPSANVKSYAIKNIGIEGQPISKVYYAFENSKNFNSEGRSDSQSTNLTITGKSTLDKPYADETSFTLRIQWDGKEEKIAVVKK
ncbi:hypothetical protein [Paenibacillus sp. UNC451MF]|uniref:hypothetical protein n=1 Tax=Paenibacillus sp. UNC451MF TaxID=1449063 RepID=UPI00048EF68F|nr:hypothetical protein [Paenibacillus sp. UNC451MF]